MDGILSPRFWVQTFVGVVITMILIYLVKIVAKKYNIPVLSQVADGV